MNKLISSILAVSFALTPLSALAEQRPDMHKIARKTLEAAANHLTTVAAENAKDFCQLYPTEEEKYIQEKETAKQNLTEIAKAKEAKQEFSKETEVYWKVKYVYAAKRLELLERQCAMSETEINAINELPKEYAKDFEDMKKVMVSLQDASFHQIMKGFQSVLAQEYKDVYSEITAVKDYFGKILKDDTSLSVRQELFCYLLWEYAHDELEFIDRILATDDVNMINNVLAKEYGDSLDKLKHLWTLYVEDLDVDPFTFG